MELLGTFTPTPPYDFERTLDIVRRYAYPVLDHAHDGAYWRVVESGDGLALLCVREHDSALEVYLAAQTGTIDREGLLPTMRRILNVDADLRPFYAQARQHPALWGVVEPIAGIRWLRTATVFEALCITIIEQQIAWVAAQKAQHWLLQWANREIIHDGRTYYAFPTPAQIAAATVDDLTPLKITFRRMRLLIAIAQQMMDGALDLEALRGESAESAYAALTAIKGVGHWTAAWTLTRAQGTFAYVGHNDVALQAAVNHYFYGGSGRIPEAQVTETFAPFGEFAGLAAHHTMLRWMLDRYEG